MKHLLAYLLSGFFAIAFAWGAETSEFEFSADLPLPPGEPAFVRVVLGPDLWATSRQSLDDLRVFDETGKEVPFALIQRGSGSRLAESLVVQPSEVWREAEGEAWVLKIAVPDMIPQVARLCIETRTAPFYHQARLSGLRRDGSRVTQEAVLYDLAPQVQARKTCIELPDWDVEAIELRLEPGKEGTARRIEVDLSNVQGSIREQISGNELRIDRLRLYADRGSEWQAQTLDFDLEPRGRRSDPETTVLQFKAEKAPLMSLELDIAEAHFSRPYVLRGLDEDEETIWQRAGRLERPVGATSEPLEISLNGQSARFLELTIEDGDSPSLTLNSARGRMIRHELVIPVEGDSFYRLFWGSSTVKAPRYDLHQVLSVSPPDLEDYPLAELEELKLNPEYEPDMGESFRSVWERMGIPLLTVLLVLGLAVWLATLLTQSARQQQR